MSTAASVKNWLKGKKSADFSKIPLVKLDTLSVPFAPPKGSPSFHAMGGVIDMKPVVNFVPSHNPAHEIARLMEKAVAKVSDDYVGSRSHYFFKQWVGGKQTIKAGCIMGAVILEMEGGEEIARRIVESPRNTMSWGGLCATGVIPAKYLVNQNGGAFVAVHMAQTMNDQGSHTWRYISSYYSREVGYHRAKVAA